MSEYGNTVDGLVYETSPETKVVEFNPMNVYSGERLDFGRSDQELLLDSAESYLDLAEDAEMEGADSVDVIAENEALQVEETQAEFKIIDLSNNDVPEDNAKGDIINMNEIAFANLIRGMVNKFEGKVDQLTQAMLENAQNTETVEDDYSGFAEETTVVDDAASDLKKEMEEAAKSNEAVITDVDVKVPQFSF